MLRFHLMSAKAMEPKYATVGSAGMDLFSAEDCVVPANGKKTK